MGGRRGHFSGREEGTDRHGGDLDAIGRGVAHLLGAVMIAIAAAAGGQIGLFDAGQQQRCQQREAEGDQQQDYGRVTPHQSIVLRL